MNRKTIVVDIDEEGNASIDGQGFTGTECEKFIKEISSCLGCATNTTKKKEYNARVVKRERERN